MSGLQQDGCSCAAGVDFGVQNAQPCPGNAEAALLDQPGLSPALAERKYLGKHMGTSLRLPAALKLFQPHHFWLAQV